MLDSVKDVLNKEVDVKGILTKEVKVKEFLEMEIELTKLKQLLATEIKLKEFLVQEIDLTSLLSNKSRENPKAEQLAPSAVIEESNDVDDDVSAEEKILTEKEDKSTKIKKDLPAFDFALIESLHEDHKRIRFIFNRLMSFAVEKEYAKVAGQLETFNKEIREHYQKTDVELYAYLKTYVQLKYPQREKAFAQLNFEMKNNSIEIFYIISQSPNIPLTEETYRAFMKEFMAVGKLMNERINKEKELLFKMYEQTNAVTSIS